MARFLHGHSSLGRRVRPGEAPAAFHDERIRNACSDRGNLICRCGRTDSLDGVSAFPHRHGNIDSPERNQSGGGILVPGSDLFLRLDSHSSPISVGSKIWSHEGGYPFIVFAGCSSVRFFSRRCSRESEASRLRKADVAKGHSPVFQKETSANVRHGHEEEKA